MAVTESIRRVLCALETYLYPHTVLRKCQAAHWCAPVRLRFGGGAAHGHHQGLLLYGQEREQASNQTRRVWAQCLCAQERSATHEVPHGRARWSGYTHGDPVRRQARLLSSLTPGERGRDRTRPSVSTGNRRLGPAYGPRPSRPCPSRVFSRGGPDTFGPQDCCGETGSPLRKRPT
jgi:hypothetical protein